MKLFTLALALALTAGCSSSGDGSFEGSGNYGQNLRGELPTVGTFDQASSPQLSVYGWNDYDYSSTTVEALFTTETGVSMIQVEMWDSVTPGSYSVGYDSWESDTPLWVLGCSGQDESYDAFDEEPEDGVVVVSEDPENGDLILDLDLDFGNAGFSSGQIRVHNTY